MRLIDKDALYREYEKVAWYDNDDRDTAEDILEEQPTIDAQTVVHGEWICNPDNSKFSLVCSTCGQVMPFVPEYLPKEPPFCNCGAKMDLGKEG